VNDGRCWDLTNLLLDTSILIDHLRQYRPATEFLETLFNGGVPAFISVVTEMELYAGKSMQKASNEEDVTNFLELFNCIPITSNIARQAGGLLRNYRHQGLTPSDAFIASTAIVQKTNLITRNVKHFRMIKGLLVFDLPTD